LPIWDFIENHKNSHNSPYKFNVKEQDALKGRYDAMAYPSVFNSNGTVDYSQTKGDRSTHEN